MSSVIVLGALLFAGLIGGVVKAFHHGTRNRYDENWWVALPICVGIVLIGLCCLYMDFRVGTTSTVADLEAFNDATLAVFEYTADETENVTIYVSDQVLIDAGYWEQGVAVSDRLSELRDKVDWYNSTLAEYRKFNNMWFTDGFCADVPDRLEYITIGRIAGEE